MNFFLDLSQKGLKKQSTKLSVEEQRTCLTGNEIKMIELRSDEISAKEIYDWRNMWNLVSKS